MSMTLAGSAAFFPRLSSKKTMVVSGFAIVIGLMSGALAREDIGDHTFFQQEATRSEPLSSGGAQGAQSEGRSLTIQRSRERQAVYRRRENKPLKVRAVASSRPVKTQVASPAVAQAAPMAWAAPGDPHFVVSLYQDKTLRRGDVVILRRGLRVFAGSRLFPYIASDFVTLAESHDVGKQFLKELNDIAHNQTKTAG